MSQRRDSMPSIDESDNEEEDISYVDDNTSTSDYSSFHRGKNTTLRKVIDSVTLGSDEFLEDCDKNATLKAVDASETTIEDNGYLNLPSKNNSDSTSINDTVQTDRFGFIGGYQYTEPNSDLIVPIDVTRCRERKWQEMLNKWDDYKNKKRKKLTLRCRKGIPQSIRCKAWQFLCNSRSMEVTFQERMYYKEQLRPAKKVEKSRSSFRNSTMAINNCESDTVSVASFCSVASPSQLTDWSFRPRGGQHYELYDNYKKCTASHEVVEQIRKDIHRQFPNHDFFMTKGGLGQESLSNILTVYSIRHPETGYCQGMAPVAAALLMVMPEEDAFWTFDKICEFYIPGYYDDGLKQIQADAKALNLLLKKENQAIYNHLNAHQIDPICFMIDWFMCIYIRTLPWPSVLLVMDMFLCEGKVILFKVALVLIVGSLTAFRRSGDDQQETDVLSLLRKLPDEITTPKYLTTNISKLSVTKTDIMKETRKQEKIMRELDTKSKFPGKR